MRMPNENKYLWHKVAPANLIRAYSQEVPLEANTQTILNNLGEEIFKVYARELDWCLKQGGIPKGPDYTQWRARLTKELGSRWASSILSAVKKQYRLAERAKKAHLDDLKKRLNILREQKKSGEVTHKRVGKTTSKKLLAWEYFCVSRRVIEYERRIARLVSSPLEVCLGGAGLQRTDGEAWLAKRFFLGAQGESGKRFGNEAFQLAPLEGGGFCLRVNVPECFKGVFGDKISVGVPAFVYGGGNIFGAVNSRVPVSVEFVREAGTIDSLVLRVVCGVEPLRESIGSGKPDFRTMIFNILVL